MIPSAGSVACQHRTDGVTSLAQGVFNVRYCAKLYRTCLEEIEQYQGKAVPARPVRAHADEREVGTHQDKTNLI